MNDVINKLSDIEQASVNIMDSANARKKEIAAQMEDSYAAHHTEYAQALFRTMTER